MYVAWLPCDNAVVLPYLNVATIAAASGPVVYCLHFTSSPFLTTKKTVRMNQFIIKCKAQPLSNSKTYVFGVSRNALCRFPFTFILEAEFEHSFGKHPLPSRPGYLAKIRWMNPRGQQLENNQGLQEELDDARAWLSKQSKIVLGRKDLQLQRVCFRQPFATASLCRCLVLLVGSADSIVREILPINSTTVTTALT